MTAVIASIGTSVPDTSMSQAQTLDMARKLAWGDLGSRVTRVYENSGIHRRGSVIFVGDGRGGGHEFYEPARCADDRGPSTDERLSLYRQFAGPLAIRACAEALAGADMQSTGVTHIVTASCTGGDAPGVDQEILRGLGCSADVQRTHLGFMGCHAAINALRVARALVLGDPNAVVLVCCVELCTLHLLYGARLDGLVANALFADGAAAAIVRSENAGQAALYSIESTASRIFEDSANAMSWNIGDHGFEMALSVRTPAMLKDRVPGWISDWLAREGRSRGDISHWAIHPGGPRVLDDLGEALGLEADDVGVSRAVLRANGNMSSATILFVLDRTRPEMEAGELCLAMAFGPGLAGEGLLVRAV